MFKEVDEYLDSLLWFKVSKLQRFRVRLVFLFSKKFRVEVRRYKQQRDAIIESLSGNGKINKAH